MTNEWKNGKKGKMDFYWSILELGVCLNVCWPTLACRLLNMLEL